MNLIKEFVSVLPPTALAPWNSGVAVGSTNYRTIALDSDENGVVDGSYVGSNGCHGLANDGSRLVSAESFGYCLRDVVSNTEWNLGTQHPQRVKFVGGSYYWLDRLRDPNYPGSKVLNGGDIYRATSWGTSPVKVGDSASLGVLLQGGFEVDGALIATTDDGRLLRVSGGVIETETNIECGDITAGPDGLVYVFSLTHRAVIAVDPVSLAIVDTGPSMAWIHALAIVNGSLYAGNAIGDIEGYKIYALELANQDSGLTNPTVPETPDLPPADNEPAPAFPSKGKGKGHNK